MGLKERLDKIIEDQINEFKLSLDEEKMIGGEKKQKSPGEQVGDVDTVKEKSEGAHKPDKTEFETIKNDTDFEDLKHGDMKKSENRVE